MKKLVKTLLMAGLILPCIAACGEKEPVETRSEEEIIIEKAKEAIGQVCIKYNDFAGSAGVTSDQVLQVKVAVDGYNFSMDYALTSAVDYGENHWASIVAGTNGNKKLKVVVPGTADLPSENNRYAAYTMTVTPSFVNYAEDFVAPKGLEVTEQYFNKSYVDLKRNVKIRINSMKTFEISIPELYSNSELSSGKSRVITYGIYAGTGAMEDKFAQSSSSNSLYFDDGAYTVVGYNSKMTTVPEGMVVGAVYKISGTYKNYYDTIELDQVVVEAAPEYTACEAPVIGVLAESNLNDKTHASAMTRVTGTITRVAVSYGKTWSHQNTKASVYINITGATNSDGTLKEEAYAYIHQFDLEADYNSWATAFDPEVESSYLNATVTFEGRWYWYSGFTAFYHSHLVSFVAPTVA